MRKERVVKKMLALTAVSAMTLSMFALSGRELFAANAIKVDGKCSLTVETETTDQTYKSDIDGMDIPVELYRVAEVSETAQYKELDGFAGIGLDQISDQTTADDWLGYSEKAAQMAEGKTPDQTITVQNGTARESDLQTGMYLVQPKETFNSDRSYKYVFQPYLISLPGNQYAQGEYGTGTDDWIYDVTVGLKVSREMQYGRLAIDKELASFNSLAGEGYFVFQVEGEKDGEKYSNVTSVTFDKEAGTKTAFLDHIPVGMEVTVTEIYSGGSYKNVGAKVKKATIISDELADGKIASVKFENTYDDKLVPGTGVLNRFKTADGKTWEWVKNDESGPAAN